MRLVDDDMEYRPDEMAGAWLVLAPRGLTQKPEGTLGVKFAAWTPAFPPLPVVVSLPYWHTVFRNMGL